MMRAVLRVLCAVAFIVVITAQPSRAEIIEFPGVGVWNGFNNQTNVVELIDLSGEGASLALTVFSSSGDLIGTQSVSLPAFGTQHIILNQYPIADAYGTYIVSNAGSGTPKVIGLTSFYRMAAPGSSTIVEYAYSLPIRNPLNGTTAGVYNSINPADANGTPVYNWLSVYNPGITPFSATVEVYHQDGSLDSANSFQINDLPSGGRQDFALGHEQGHVVGLYRIIPDNSSSDYGSFLIRYSQSGAEFNYAFPLPTRPGSCAGRPTPISTMGPATNWGEIANPTAQSIASIIEVRNSIGTLLHSETVSIAAFSQYHINLNQHLGEGNLGYFQARCVENNGSNALLVQSLFYGHPAIGSPAVDWAYASVESTEFADNSKRLAVPFNTFFAAPNWQKLLNASSASIQTNVAIHSMDGTLLNTAPHAIAASGSVDVGIHQTAGNDVVGLSLVSINSENASIVTEVLRVYPNASGGIGYIMNLPGTVVDEVEHPSLPEDNDVVPATPPTVPDAPPDFANSDFILGLYDGDYIEDPHPVRPDSPFTEADLQAFFDANVQPILTGTCASCHRLNAERGMMAFTNDSAANRREIIARGLLSYERVEAGRLIAKVTGAQHSVNGYPGVFHFDGHSGPGDPEFLEPGSPGHNALLEYANMERIARTPAHGIGIYDTTGQHFVVWSEMTRNAWSKEAERVNIYHTATRLKQMEDAGLPSKLYMQQVSANGLALLGERFDITEMMQQNPPPDGPCGFSGFGPNTMVDIDRVRTHWRRDGAHGYGVPEIYASIKFYGDYSMRIVRIVPTLGDTDGDGLHDEVLGVTWDFLLKDEDQVCGFFNARTSDTPTTREPKVFIVSDFVSDILPASMVDPSRQSPGVIFDSGRNTLDYLSPPHPAWQDQYASLWENIPSQPNQPGYLGFVPEDPILKPARMEPYLPGNPYHAFRPVESSHMIDDTKNINTVFHQYGMEARFFEVTPTGKGIISFWNIERSDTNWIGQVDIDSRYGTIEKHASIFGSSNPMPADMTGRLASLPSGLCFGEMSARAASSTRWGTIAAINHDGGALRDNTAQMAIDGQPSIWEPIDTGYVGNHFNCSGGSQSTNNGFVRRPTRHISQELLVVYTPENVKPACDGPAPAQLGIAVMSPLPEVPINGSVPGGIINVLYNPQDNEDFQGSSEGPDGGLVVDMDVLARGQRPPIKHKGYELEQILGSDLGKYVSVVHFPNVWTMLMTTGNDPDNRGADTSSFNENTFEENKNLFKYISVTQALPNPIGVIDRGGIGRGGLTHRTPQNPDDALAQLWKGFMKIFDDGSAAMIIESDTHVHYQYMTERPSTHGPMLVAGRQDRRVHRVRPGLHHREGVPLQKWRTDCARCHGSDQNFGGNPTQAQLMHFDETPQAFDPNTTMAMTKVLTCLQQGLDCEEVDFRGRRGVPLDWKNTVSKYFWENPSQGQTCQSCHGEDFDGALTTSTNKAAGNAYFGPWHPTATKQNGQSVAWTFPYDGGPRDGQPKGLDENYDAGYITLTTREDGLSVYLDEPAPHVGEGHGDAGWRARYVSQESYAHFRNGMKRSQPTLFDRSLLLRAMGFQFLDLDAPVTGFNDEPWTAPADNLTFHGIGPYTHGSVWGNGRNIGEHGSEFQTILLWFSTGVQYMTDLHEPAATWAQQELGITNKWSIVACNPAAGQGEADFCQ